MQNIFALGVLVEIVGFAHDNLSKKGKSQHGLADTNYGMLCDIFGSLVAGTVAFGVF